MVGETQRKASKFIVFENFEKMNTAGSRQGLPEKELAWLENLQSIAPNKLQTVPAAAADALATIGSTALSAFFASISGSDYIVAFTTAGAGYFINLSTGVVNNFAPAGTFSNPDVTTWQASRILINDETSSYCTFDGSIFVRQGGVSPVFSVTNGGSGYSTAPPVTISGGSGTGATAHSVIQLGVVVAVVLDNPGIGYNASDVLTVTFGTGVGSGATGHVTMSGFNVASINITNPGDFSTPGAGTYSLSFSGGGGSAAAGTATVAVNKFGRFSVTAIQLTAGGTGYTSPPIVTLATTGGTAPTFAAFLGTETVATIVKDASGSGYVTPPNVSIQGGGATTAATAHATLTGNTVNTLVLDTAGAGYTSTPTVVIGTGSGAAATGHVWPFVPAGSTLAVFQGRVWLAGGTLLQYTGTQGYDDFAAANASGSLQITDADLVHSIVALRSYNNYLFIVGDESIKQIGNITVSGSTTLFTILTLSSDQGTIFRDSCASFNRVFTFLNKNGIYAVLGSSVQKVSGDLDGIFGGLDFSSLNPQAALVDFNGIHYVTWLVKYADPYTGTTRSILLVFDGRRWFFVSQGDSLLAITTTSTLASGQHLTYGSSGTDIRQLLADATTAVAWRWRSSMSHHGNAVQRKKLIRASFGLNLASGTSSVVMTVDTENGADTEQRSIRSGYQLNSYTQEGSGVFLGLTLTGTNVGLTLTIGALEYQDTALGGNR